MEAAKKIFKKFVKGYKILSTPPEKKISPIPVEIEKIKPPLKVPEEPKEKIERKIKEIKALEGVEIPEVEVRKIKIMPEMEAEEKPQFLITYPLIPRKPAKGEPIFAYARISWDPRASRFIYEVVEPELTPYIRSILQKIKDLLEQRLDIDISKMKKVEATEYLNKQISEIISYFGFKLTETEQKIIRYYIERDFIGLGKIEPLMQDPQIEDINCDGVKIPIFVYHRDPRLASIITNVSFDDADELDSFITRLAQICGKSISVAQPLLDATLPDGSRLQATLGTDIARRGSNFTIRKFTEEPLTQTHLMKYGTIDAKTLAYLWLCVDYGRNILVSGGTASGKTTLLNVLSLFIRPEKKIISIEDTAELRLPHPHWVPMVARAPISVEGKIGEVDMFDLLRESFRQRPEHLIVGEVRGREAFILFQQMATGHAGLATIHAENMSKLLDRLITPPISLPPSLITSVDVIVFLMRGRYKDRFVRRVSEVLEIVDYDPKTKLPIVNTVFRWNPVNDKIEVVDKSIVLKRISEATGISVNDLAEEMRKRTMILNWMREKNILNYQDVYKIINTYYHYPQRLLAAIMGEM